MEYYVLFLQFACVSLLWQWRRSMTENFIHGIGRGIKTVSRPWQSERKYPAKQSWLICLRQKKPRASFKIQTQDLRETHNTNSDILGPTCPCQQCCLIMPIPVACLMPFLSKYLSKYLLNIVILSTFTISSGSSFHFTITVNVKNIIL